MTVSSIGLSGGASVSNNGADYGPDTSGTSTSGLHEAIGFGYGTKWLLPGPSGQTLTLGSGVSIDGSSSHTGAFYVKGSGFYTFVLYNVNSGTAFLVGQTNGFNAANGGVVFEDFVVQAPSANTSVASLFKLGYWNPVTKTGVPATQIYLRRLNLFAESSYLIDVETGGGIFIESCLMNNPSDTGIDVYINNNSGGPIWIRDCDFNYGVTAGGTGIYINSGLAGGYVFRGCNFTHFTNGACLDVEGQTTDLLIEGCEFDGSKIGVKLNATVNTSVIKGNSFTGNTTNLTLGSGASFYPYKLIIMDNPGLNPFGALPTPFQNTVPSGGSPWMGPGGSSTSPTSGTVYRVEICDQLLTFSGGSVSIKDPSGNLLLSASSLSAFRVPVGYTMDFSGTPTVAVYGT